MALNSVLSTATSGLGAAAKRADSAASNIANINTPGYEATTVAQTTLVSGDALSSGTAVNAQIIGGDAPPDLGTEIVRLLEAETTYKLNASVFRTASEISRETLNLTA